MSSGARGTAVGRELGVETSEGDVFEPRSGMFREVWPPPTVSSAAFIAKDQKPTAPMLDLSQANHIFREDSFDATTRIRRGRFYRRDGAARTMLARRHDGPDIHPWIQSFSSEGSRPPARLVAIGIEDSLWRILNAERISTGEWLVTLKARGGSGLLPEVDVDKVPELGRPKVVKAVDHMVDVAHRETLGSIVDAARNTACLRVAVYAAALEEEVEKQREIRRRDLAKVRAYFEGHTKLKGMVVAISASRILERLHPRNKPGEQKKHNLRLITEGDATFAVGGIGLLLNELGWAQETV